MAPCSRPFSTALIPALVLVLLAGAATPPKALAEDETPPTAPLAQPASPEGALAPVAPEAAAPNPSPTPEQAVAPEAASSPEVGVPAPAPTEAELPAAQVAAPEPTAAAPAEIPPPLDIAGGPTAHQSTGGPHGLAYQQIKPPVAVEISSSLEALGSSPGIPRLNTANVRALKIELEYQPPFLQRFGVIGFGPSLSTYPLAPRGNIANSAFSLWSVGAQIRYQARFFHEQIIVPIAGYSFEALTYHLNQGGVGRLNVTGPLFGAYLLLNPFEPSAAGDSYIDSGITRTYVVAELRTRNGKDASVSLSGSSLFLGLRFEF